METTRSTTSRGDNERIVMVVIAIISWKIQADDLVELTKLVKRSAYKNRSK